MTPCNDSHENNSSEPSGRTLRHAFGNKRGVPPMSPVVCFDQRKAMERVKLLLEAEKSPQLPVNVHHTYEEKRCFERA